MVQPVGHHRGPAGVQGLPRAEAVDAGARQREHELVVPHEGVVVAGVDVRGRRNADGGVEPGGDAAEEPQAVLPAVQPPGVLARGLAQGEAADHQELVGLHPPGVADAGHELLHHALPFLGVEAQGDHEDLGMRHIRGHVDDEDLQDLDGQCK